MFGVGLGWVGSRFCDPNCLWSYLTNPSIDGSLYGPFFPPEEKGRRGQ
jgi:hypothetical protein